MHDALSQRSSERPRVAIVGAGAMGSIFGAAFTDAGAEKIKKKKNKR